MKHISPLFRLALLGLAAMVAIAIGMSANVVVGLVLFGLMANALVPRRLSALGVNTLGTLATATIVMEALDLVFTKRPFLKNISMGFTDKNGSPIAAYNQQVITRTLGLPTVGNFGDADSATADVDVPVTLNNFKQLSYTFTPTEYSGTNRDLIRERAEPMAVALGNYMVDAVAGLWTVANFPVRTGADAVANNATNNITVLGAGWDYAHLLTVRAALAKAGVPDYRRFYVGSADVYASMLSDLRIVSALNNPDNQSAIMKGELPRVSGMAIEEYPNLTTAAGANLVGAAGTPDSTVYAARVPRDPRELLPGLPIPGNMGVVTHPKTGLSVMVLEYITMSSLAVTTKLVWMYGVAKGNVNNLQLVKSQ
jgi:hypothetical protein